VPRPWPPADGMRGEMEPPAASSCHAAGRMAGGEPVGYEPVWVSPADASAAAERGGFGPFFSGPHAAIGGICV